MLITVIRAMIFFMYEGHYGITLPATFGHIVIDSSSLNLNLLVLFFLTFLSFGTMGIIRGCMV